MRRRVVRVKGCENRRSASGEGTSGERVQVEKESQ